MKRAIAIAKIEEFKALALASGYELDREGGLRALASWKPGETHEAWGELMHIRIVTLTTFTAGPDDVKLSAYITEGNSWAGSTQRPVSVKQALNYLRTPLSERRDLAG